jgi:hypothetical protein
MVPAVARDASLTDRGAPHHISSRIGRKPATIEQGEIMKRIIIGSAVAALVAVPAAVGLWGNASFSQEVPVRTPASGQVLTPTPTPPQTPTPSASPNGTDDTGTDDNGGDTPRDQRTEPGDDRDVQGGSTAPAPAPAPAPYGADDNGGDTPRDQRREPGDDRDSSGDDDNGSGSGSSGSGSSSDDSGSDDHGGHGSDD